MKCSPPNVFCLVLVGLTCLLNAGCHHAFGNKCVRASQWQLDPEHRVTLLFVSSTYPEWAGEELTYSQAEIQIRNTDPLDNRLEDEAILYYHKGSKRWTPSKDRYEVRADETRRRIWVVNLASGNIVGTYNIETGETSGSKGAKPAWAQRTGGVVLQRIDSSEEEKPNKT